MTLVVLASAVLPGCGGDSTGSGPAGSGDRPLVVATTSILGDLVGNVVGDAAAVEVIMPPGTDPHDFEPSARQAASLRRADLIVENGLGFEEGLLRAVDSAERDGVTVYEASDAVDALPLAGEDLDPHWFTDPLRSADAVEGIAEALARSGDIPDPEGARRRAADYSRRLRNLAEEMEETLAKVRPAERILVTNHEVFAYFADRFDFEVVGVVVPGGSTLAEPSSTELAELTRTVEDAGVAAIFAETTSPSRLADAVADEVGSEVDVVELYTESLGEPGSPGATYAGMMRTDAERIAEALS